MSEAMPNKKPIVLCILDGWGIGDGGEFDAIASADTPNFDAMMARYPNSRLETCGAAVGLPDGQMGNSEVGHMNIGAGRVVMQYLPRISKAFANGDIQRNKSIQALAKNLKATGKACHIMGLLSDGGVHAHIDHIIELANIMASHGVLVHIHAFTDGRDCPPDSGQSYIGETEKRIAANDLITLSTISGRYYAMDRDNRWDRVQLAYDAIIGGKGEKSASPEQAMAASYDAEIYDEFIKPIIIGDYQGMQDGDGVIFANFRNDRAREILKAMLFDDFDGFARAGGKPAISKVLGLVEYSQEHNKYIETLFPAIQHKNTFGEVISSHGLTQIRMAETEKYPHVTFFFNCGKEDPYQGEDRIMVASPSVATYDLQPEMSAPELTDKLVAAIDSDKYDVVIVNFANTDMVGHTGNLKAAISAVESVDSSIGRLRDIVPEKGGVLLISADHGNADQMIDSKTGGKHTAHTLNPVPFIVVGAGDVTLKNGKLADIAPTMLKLLGIPQPSDMDGDVLIG